MTLLPIVVQPPHRKLPGYLRALDKSLNDCKLWWATCGYFFIVEPPMLLETNDINLTLQNPWNEVYSYLNDQGVFKPGRKMVALLEGWDGRGWGGNPLALVGDWAIERVKSTGNPSAVMDDYAAAGVIGHELGHVFGMGHDLTFPQSIMWSACYDFPNNVYLRPEWIQRPETFQTQVSRLASVGTPYRLGAMDGPCPL